MPFGNTELTLSPLAAKKKRFVILFYLVHCTGLERALAGRSFLETLIYLASYGYHDPVAPYKQQPTLRFHTTSRFGR